MADINVQIKQRNAENTGWDNLYPKTKGSLVDVTGGNVEQHVIDTTKHITAAERSAWNAKQSALGFTPENSANKGAANGYAGLGADGKIPNSQLPAIAITDTFVVSTQAAMLALTAQTGDVCVRSDINKSFILKEEPASTLSNWQELLTPSNAVISVNSKTGAVTLTAGDVGAAPSGHVGAGGTAHADATTSAAGFMSAADKTKLNGIAAGANNYTHPANHPPSIISQDASNRFVTDAEKSTWNAKQKAITVSSTAPSSPAAGELFFEIL